MYVEKKIDKVRRFRMSMMAQKRIETHFKKPFGKIDQDNLLVDDYIFMLWACLEQKDRDELTEEKLLEIIDEKLKCPNKEVYELFTDIVMDGFGMEKNSQGIVEEEETVEENGTGKEPLKTLSK